MELQLRSAEQVKIADLLWAADSQAEVDRIVRVFGHDGRIVYEMLLAAHFDSVDDVSDAKAVLATLFGNC